VSDKQGNTGVERAVVSGLCQYGKDAWIDVSDIIDSSSFVEQHNQMIFRVIDNIINIQGIETIDLSSIVATAETLGFSSTISDRKYNDYIRSIFNFPVELANVRVHAKKLAKLEIARKWKNKLKDIYNKMAEVTGDETIDEIVNIPESALFDMVHNLYHNTDNNPVQIAEGNSELLNDLINNPIEMIGVPTPWPIYNEIIGGGLRPGVSLIAARPKIGKSSLAKDALLHISGKMNIPTLYIDTEMDKTEQVFRMLATLSDVPTKRIETGYFGQDDDEKERVFLANKELEAMPLSHKRVGGMDFKEILSIVRRWIFKDVGFDDSGEANPCVIVYDYFKLMNVETLQKMQEFQALGFQISELSDFTKQYSIPCLAFVQTNREGIKETGGSVLSGSDRLLWLCISACDFKRKTSEEIEEDGPEFGNRKLVPIECRYGSSLSDNDYIHMNLQGNISKVTELGTKSASIKDEDDSGFTGGKPIPVEDDEEEDDCPF
jgi:replicative DNA helicase